MANEYIELETLKAYVNDSTDNHDALLEQCRTAASRAVDNHCGRVFYNEANPSARVYRIRDRVVREPDGDLLIVDDISSLTGLLVEVGSGSTWTTVTDYTTEPDNALVRGLPITYLRRPVYSWSSQPQTQVRVTARFGFPSIPDEVVQATLIQAARLFKRKDTVDGVRGADQFGVSVRLSRIDPDVQALLRPYVIHAIG